MTEREQDDIRYRQIIAGMTLMDDEFMTVFFNKRPDLVEYVIRIILERDDLRVTESKTQYEYRGVTTRSVRMDIRAVDDAGRVYDIEIQRSEDGSGERRARMYSSTLDRDLLKKSQDFEELVDTYVIFITDKDRYGEGFPVYHIDRTIAELSHRGFGDGAHILYVNGEYRNTTEPIGRLMHDFHEKRAAEMLCPPLAEQVKYYKETEGGVENMNNELREFWEEKLEKARKQEREQAERRKTIEFAKSLIANGKLSYEEISNICHLTVDEVKQLASQRTA